MTLAEYERSGRTFIVAEIAQAHDGSVGILHSLLESAAATGVDAVKFQMHMADAESSSREPFRIPFSRVDATRFDYWKRMELSAEQWAGVKEHCDALGIEFLVTPFSNAAIDLLERLGVKRYKVGSADVSNLLLVEKLARTGREVIVSTGLATPAELDSAIQVLRDRAKGIAVLQCTTKYPTQAADVGLGTMAVLRERYGCPVGLSDHSGKTFGLLGAVALGATILEAHVTFDRRMFGPDAHASLTIDEFRDLVGGARFLEQARQAGPEKRDTASSDALRRTFGKALAVNRDMRPDDVLRFEDLEGKKPADAGVHSSRIFDVIGRKLVRAKSRWDFLEEDDLA